MGKADYDCVLTYRFSIVELKYLHGLRVTPLTCHTFTLNCALPMSGGLLFCREIFALIESFFIKVFSYCYDVQRKYRDKFVLRIP